MSFSKTLERIKKAIAIRNKGLSRDTVIIERRDIQELMAHFDSMETELRVIHSRRAGLKDNSTATEYLISSENNARRLSESVNRINSGEIKPLVMGAPNGGSLLCPCQNYPLCACAGCIPLTPVLHKDADSNNIYQMIIEQNPERRTEHRKPVTSFDWELQQALIHLQNAISVTDSRRGHLLQAAVSITKGVRESE
jgi:hypothetical protein